MRISAEYCPLRPMPVQKNGHLTDQPTFLLSVQRSQHDLKKFRGFGRRTLETNTINLSSNETSTQLTRKHHGGF
jgi:hypothetical protein